MMTLHLGDCLDVLRTLPADSVDAVVTDPPAGIGFMGRRWDTFSADLPQPDFLNWFAGFVDGEGCFSVHKKPQDTYDCQFSISLRADDRPILLEIQRTLGIGTVSKPTAHSGGGNGKPQCRFCISSKAECVRLSEILRAAPLRAKKARDFEIWFEALNEWVNHKSGDWLEMAGARERLMASREYTDFGKAAGPPERRAFIAFLKPILRECLRVARPGAVALVWALPRTSHWTGTAIEDAGWVIEDRIAHLFGSGFPKHKSKLKPACEDWWLCRKPGPKWLGVEQCRIPGVVPQTTQRASSRIYGNGDGFAPAGLQESNPHPAGRWPAHVTLDDEAAALLDAQSGELHGAGFAQGPQEKWSYECGKNCYGKGDIKAAGARIGDTGGASRFFYVSKASRDDRGKGNAHPTVKSTALMRWLVKLACPDGGTVLDCFMGSGSTGVAAILEGRRFVGIERDPQYFAIAEQRIRAAAEADRQSLFPLADAPPASASPPDLFAENQP